MSKKETVSIVGLGQMGAALARAYINAGHRVTVWNRTPSKAEPFQSQAKVAETPAQTGHRLAVQAGMTLRVVTVQPPFFERPIGRSPPDPRGRRGCAGDRDPGHAGARRRRRERPDAGARPRRRAPVHGVRGRAVNAWLVFAGALLVAGLIPALVIGTRGKGTLRLVGLQFGSAVTVLLLVALCASPGATSYLVVPLALVLLSFAGTLVYTRLLSE